MRNIVCITEYVGIFFQKPSASEKGLGVSTKDLQSERADQEDVRGIHCGI